MSQVNVSIAKNTSWFSFALIIQKIIAFVYFTYLARLLGAESIGQYVFAISYITIFAVIINLGTNHFITREVAKNYRSVQKITSNIFGFKIFSSFIAILAALAVAHLLNYQTELISLLYIAMAIMIIESFVLSIYSIIRGYENLKYEALTTILVHVLILILGIGVARTTGSVWWLLVVLLISHGLNLIYGLYLLKSRFLLKLSPAFEFKYWREIWLTILPFALAAAFSKIWGAFDQVILAKFANPKELGYYGVAYKLTFAFQFIPLALVAALYPAMSRYFSQNKAKLTELFSRSVNYLLLITLPLASGIFLFGHPLLLNLYTSEFEPALLPMQILFVSLPFLFLNFPLGSLLNACNFQKRQSLNIGIAMIVSIVLNLILIPKFFALGAAWASFLSNAVYFIMGWLAIKQIINYDYKKNLLVILKINSAVILMILAGLFLQKYFSWFLSMLFSGAIYFIMIYISGAFSKHEIVQFTNTFKK